MVSSGSAPVPLQHPEQTDASAEGRWALVIFNDDVTPYDTVIVALVHATACTIQEAEIETWEAHHFGSCQVHFGDQIECEAAGQIVSSYGIKTEVRPEWAAE